MGVSEHKHSTLVYGDGLMESMMGMVLRHGLEGAGIEGNIEKV